MCFLRNLIQIGAKEKGYFVEWAPQEEDLTHQAV